MNPKAPARMLPSQEHADCVLSVRSAGSQLAGAPTYIRPPIRTFLGLATGRRVENPRYGRLRNLRYVTRRSGSMKHPGYRTSCTSNSASEAQGPFAWPDFATKRTNRPDTGLANVMVFRPSSFDHVPVLTGSPQP